MLFDDNYLDGRGRIRTREYSVDEKDFALNDKLSLIRNMMGIIVTASATVILLLLYVFNTSADHSSFVMQTIVVVFVFNASLVFALRLLYEFIIDRHERAKGKMSMRFGPKAKIGITQEEFVEEASKKDDDTS